MKFNGYLAKFYWYSNAPNRSKLFLSMSSVILTRPSYPIKTQSHSINVQPNFSPFLFLSMSSILLLLQSYPSPSQLYSIGPGLILSKLQSQHPDITIRPHYYQFSSLFFLGEPDATKIRAKKWPPSLSVFCFTSIYGQDF